MTVPPPASGSYKEKGIDLPAGFPGSSVTLWLPIPAGMVLRVWHLLAVVGVLGLLAFGALSLMHTSATTKVAAGTAAQAAQGPSLDTYLAKVQVQQARFLRLQAASSTSLDRIHGLPDAQWPIAAAELRDARDTYNQIAVELRVIQAPEELASEHAGLAKSVELFANYTDSIQQSLADSDAQGFISAVNASGPDRSVEMRSAWRNGVVAYARAIKARVPRWVLEVGTRH